MSDVKLTNIDSDFLLSYKLGDFESDEGLETAVLVSLFTDRRIKEDELIAPNKDRKGWWGDIAIPGERDLIGSKLWLLERGKLDEKTRFDTEQYAAEALQWMIDDGVAESVTARAVLVPRLRIELYIDIKRPKEKDKYFYRYQLLWNNQLTKTKV